MIEHANTGMSIKILLLRHKSSYISWQQNVYQITVQIKTKRKYLRHLVKNCYLYINRDMV